MEHKSFGLYLHIPYCMQKCRYCDFLSFVAEDGQKRDYVDALKKEVEYWGHIYGRSGKNHRVATIYYGGGTPSILPAIYIEEIQTEVHRWFEVEENAEATIECNPGAVNLEKFCRYRKAGLNRISMGLQSTVDEELKMLGRIHNYQDFLDGYHQARQAGFQNISVDLMSALPGQSCVSYLESLKKIADLQPEHISSYSLIIEEGTDFYRQYEEGKLILPDEEEEREMYTDTKTYLQSRGYERYEISNYCRPGYASRHNSSYWTGKEYLGLGLGASSYIEGIRFKNPENRKSYMERSFLGDYKKDYKEVEILTKEMQMQEFVFLGLRMAEGISVMEFQKRFGENFFEKYEGVCQELLEEGLIFREGERIALTEKGVDVSNYVFEKFF